MIRHCILSFRGEDFRKAYKQLSSLKAYFPDVNFIAMTGTASAHMVSSIKQSLALERCSIVSMSPNRSNIFLKKVMRPANNTGLDGYDRLLRPIAEELRVLREMYPMTIIYVRLKYCGYAYSLFERIMKSEQYVGTDVPSNRLFAQFHAPQTTLMKEEIIKEIKKPDSAIRVVFATSALGMGVDSPHVVNIIHISPPDSLEAYYQEIGRAGRANFSANAILYYNNSDLGNNVTNVNKSMKEYCLLDTCMRAYLIGYFGFSVAEQEMCCSVCESMDESVPHEEHTVDSVVRTVSTDGHVDLETELRAELLKFQLTCQNNILYSHYIVDIDNLVNIIMDNIESIYNESYFLGIGIFDEDHSLNLFSIINRYSSDFDPILS